MTEKQVLIVGAGALGLTCAYHLQLAGAGISFLVRPHRQETLSRAQKLYCFNDDQVKVLDNFQLFTSPGELKGKHFDFVMLTLDGSTCRSDQGVATLNMLGRELADTGANLLICGVGIGLYEHIKKVTGFAEANILQGTMRMFAYQVADWPDEPRPPTDIERYHECDIAYLGFANRVGFFMASTPGKAAKAFSQLWKESGVSLCQRMPKNMYAAFSNAFFPFTIACELQGWQGTEVLISDSQLWPLCCDAQREILGLNQFGLTGKLMSKLMNNKRLEKMMRDMDEGGERIGFTAFNRFHHGGKVLDQDIEVVRNCVAAGEQQGRNMSATKTLLDRWSQLQ